MLDVLAQGLEIAGASLAGVEPLLVLLYALLERGQLVLALALNRLCLTVGVLSLFDRQVARLNLKLVADSAGELLNLLAQLGDLEVDLLEVIQLLRHRRHAPSISALALDTRGHRIAKSVHLYEVCMARRPDWNAGSNDDHLPL